jgi:DNA-binding NarL/FixJ family response regulator
MHEVFDSCMEDTCRVVLVEGTVGSGKTSAVRAFADYALGQGAALLNVACSALDRDQQFGVVRELLQGVEFPPEVGLKPPVRLAEELLAVAASESDAQQARLVERRVHAEFADVLRSLARHRPVVVTVDDAQHLDVASARCLLQAMSKLSSVRITLVVTHSAITEPAAPFFIHELLRLPHSRSLQLSLLGESKVQDLLLNASPAAADLVDAETRAATGGNPLLVQAVAEDLRSAGEQVPGEHFRRAVLAALHRTSDAIIAVARGSAVLGEHCTPLLLGRLLEIEPATARDGLTALESLGLMADGQFRHPAAAIAVLDEMAATVRSKLHLRAAHLLFEHGVPASTLADHLVAAGATDASWAAEILHNAALAALAAGAAERAEQYLDLATWTGVDEQERYASKVMLLEIAWRDNPTRADHHVPYLMNALRLGKLNIGSMLSLAKHLLWRGRTTEAVEVLTALPQAPATPTEQAAVESFRLSLSHTFPPLAALVSQPADERAESTAQVPPGDTVLQDQAAGRLAALIANRADRDTVAEAAHLLRAPLNYDLTFESSRLALLTLVYSDQLREATKHCDALLKEIDHGTNPTWSATLHAIRAEIALRTGALRLAQQMAQQALDLLSRDGWGVVIGMPMSTLIAACVALGERDSAASLAYRPVPPAMLISRHGLTYLYARGHYHLAAGEAEVALADFEQCGQLMRSWDVDMPTLVPWRSGAAAVHLAAGRPDDARALVEAELALLGEDYPRARGIATRLLAASVEDPRRRVELLEVSATLLKSAGDQFEQAQALLELGASYAALGESRLSRLRTRMGLSVARKCGAANLLRVEPAALVPVETGADKALTQAESRVAVLAARGHTNREIAEQLRITPSTVEQHLTRVFRKLEVRQRQDLPASLSLLDPPSAALWMAELA